MTNLEKYNQAFAEALEISQSQLPGLEYQGIEQWDSVGHMGLVAALEDVFETASPAPKSHVPPNLQTAPPGHAAALPVGHMGLVAALEDVFDIMMDTDDIIDFSSLALFHRLYNHLSEERLPVDKRRLVFHGAEAEFSLSVVHQSIVELKLLRNGRNLSF